MCRTSQQQSKNHGMEKLYMSRQCDNDNNDSGRWQQDHHTQLSHLSCHINASNEKKGAVIQSWAFSLARVAGNKDRISSKKHMASLCFKTLESRRSGLQRVGDFQVRRWSRVLCKSGCQQKGRPVDLRNHEKSNLSN